MKRKHQVRAFKPYLMRYIHGSDPNYEPVLRDLLEHEHEVYEELTEEKEFQRGEREGRTWQVVFSELTDILTPFQIEQLFDRLCQDIKKTCDRLQGMAKPQKVEARSFRPYLLRYIEDNDQNYEPVLRDLLDHEHEVYEKMTADSEMERGARGEKTWEVVFGELTGALTPSQIEKLFGRLNQDIKSTCDRFHEMAEAQKLMERDEGGES
ncbi:MAG: hypothetical protein V3V62_05590 [bacterium]